MNFDKLNKWLTLTANIGVLAGIVFLAVEIQINNELLEAEARFNRLETRKEFNDLVVTNPDLATAVLKAGTEEDLNRAEEFVISRVSMNTLLNWQYAYQELQAGLIELDDVPIENWRYTYQNRLAISDTWEEEKEQSFRADFVRWFDENIINN